MIEVLIVDDHTIVREGLKQILANTPDILEKRMIHERMPCIAGAQYVRAPSGGGQVFGQLDGSLDPATANRRELMRY